MKTTLKTTVLAFTALTLLSACQPNMGQNHYNFSESGQAVEVVYGRVVSVKEVSIQGRNTGTGAAAGMTAGAVGGYQVGNGNGKLAATLGAMVIGGIIGHMAEQEMANQKGYKYVIVTQHKKTISVVQNQSPEDVVFRKGDRVMIEVSGGYQRVVPTDDQPDQIKRAKPIKIVD